MFNSSDCTNCFQPSSIWSLIISTLALIFSLIALYKSIKFNEAQLEIQIRTLISTSRLNIDRLKEKYFISKEYCEKDIYKNLLPSAIEDLLNAYDDACLKYLNRSISRNNFKQIYHDEIINIMENDVYADYIDNLHYDNIVKVYNEWKTAAEKQSNPQN